jgi:galactokinase
MIDQLLSVWHQKLGSISPEIIVRSPGRVNIIGEHTDYNEGWVMPGAMSRSVYILISRNNTSVHHWVANDLNEDFQYSVFNENVEMPLWGKYLEGAIRLYADDLGSLNILIGGYLPIGAGVSSSSSIVCGLLFAIQRLSGRNESKEELALIGSRVEREIIGLQGGIMDQYAIMLSQPEHVMILDCRTKKYSFIKAELKGYKWILINTKVKHQLIDSDYNNRAAECKKAVTFIQIAYPEVKSLRDVNMDVLNEIKLPDNLRKRCVFVIEENQRVHDMVDALKNLDAIAAGKLLMASHAGLRDQYEVSCDELDHLADFANTFAGVMGARMMGGGFGGCVICLLKEEILNPFMKKCISSYAGRFGFEPEVINFELGGGVEEIIKGETGKRANR